MAGTPSSLSAASDPLDPGKVVDQARADARRWFAGRAPIYYRQRPSVVEAMQATGGNFDTLNDWTDGAIVWLDFSPEDFIVKDASGEFHVYSPDAFAATFERLVVAVAE